MGKSLDNFQSLSLKQVQEVVEEKLIGKALHETGGNRLQASKLLEISYPSLLSKIKKYAISEPRAVRPGKVAYSSGCEARPGRSSQPPGSESLDRSG